MTGKATAVIMVGSTQSDENAKELGAANQQVLIMSTPSGEITGTHPDEHSFFLAEVEDTRDYLTIKVRKDTMRSAREHYKEAEKNGAKEGVDLNYLTWSSIIMKRIWSFVKH